MQLGFVSAIMPDLTLEEVFAFARDEGFACVEVMCWPVGGADRRYAGVTHLDVANVTDEAIARVHDLVHTTGVQISGLGYYPNPLHPDQAHRERVVGHLYKVIYAAPRFGVNVVNTFVGRDWRLPVRDNWPIFDQVWPDLARAAATAGVRIGIENCPMLYSYDEWPGGTNLAATPAAWTKLFEKIPSLGLNFDPSHLIWQHIDVARCIRDFGGRFVHVHAKDTRIDTDSLYRYGIMGLGWHTPKLPGLGDVAWGPFFSALTDARYQGPARIEVEDRAYEASLETRKRALRQSKRLLEQFM